MEAYNLFIGLFTLIILEVVLSVDNLILVSIIIKKLPNEQREKASKIGISLAFIAKILLLCLINWISKFKKKILNIFNLSFSIKDLILFIGGIFLIIKTSIEIYEFINKKKNDNNKKKFNKLFFLKAVFQIVAIDSLFSIDAIIAAIGIMNNIWLISLSIFIVMFLIFFISRNLIKFLENNPTITVLFLSFLLLTGFFIMLDGLNIYVSKTYLYSAVGFASLVEFFNFIMRQNIIKEKKIKKIKKKNIINKKK
ncbi:Integral membrane protein TerC family protein [Candidatus Annandia adelgestsuga]|uniref:Integral membrane protein TerC family protein n=1 Tax=Candidatus Annandia adelgestsuga TaxID=1302411 RepID=A0A3Q9CKY3_9ENTR|nr:Integral membrane protein TerC family protein [Candidatus Annandia adelgestsuga]